MTSASNERSPESVAQVCVIDRDSLSSDLLATLITQDIRFKGVPFLPSDATGALATGQFELAVISSNLTGKPDFGFSLIRSLNAQYPNVRIITLLSESDSASVLGAFHSGVWGVFSRQSPMTELIECIAHVNRGYIWVGGKEATALLQALHHLPGPMVAGLGIDSRLTDREVQVIRHVATGKTNKAIAKALSLSEHTVKNYLFRVSQKLGVSSRVELFFYLASRGHSFTMPSEGTTNAKERK